MTFNPSKRIVKVPIPKLMEASKYFQKKIWEKPDFRRDHSFSCNIKISVFASLTKNQALAVIAAAKEKPRVKQFQTETYFDTEEVIAAFDYPLKSKYLLRTDLTLDFNGKPMRMHIGYFLWQVAKFYKDEIYAYRKKYGVWGHNIDDLYFEGIILRKIGKNYYGIIEMGS
jgi:hypothetical protein